MQTAAKEALGISQETAATHRLYGIDQPETKVWGERCLIARRLVERGVRFVQIPCGNQHWDHHGGTLDRQKMYQAGNDIGFQLWDVPARRQPPPPPKPPEPGEEPAPTPPPAAPPAPPDKP